jgi:hypothetical protein
MKFFPSKQKLIRRVPSSQIERFLANVLKKKQLRAVCLEKGKCYLLWPIDRFSSDWDESHDLN